MRSRQIRKRPRGGDELTIDTRGERHSPKARWTAVGIRRPLSNGLWWPWAASGAGARFVR